MATTKEYKEYILGKLSVLETIKCRPMMGEYLLYYSGVLFGGIYDNKLLIKIVNGNKKYNLESAIPYDGAKLMYHIGDLDNRDLLKEIILETIKELPVKKK